MAVLTVTQMIAEARYQAGDSDASNLSFVDADVTAALNRAYVMVKGMQDDRTQFIAGATTGATATVANVGICLLTAVNIRRIVRLYLASSAASSTPSAGALESWEPWRAWKERAESATAGPTTTSGAADRSSREPWLPEGRGRILPRGRA